jgi:hypothetical protein
MERWRPAPADAAPSRGAVLVASAKRVTARDAVTSAGWKPALRPSADYVLGAVTVLDGDAASFPYTARE